MEILAWYTSNYPLGIILPLRQFSGNINYYLLVKVQTSTWISWLTNSNKYIKKSILVMFSCNSVK